VLHASAGRIELLVGDTHDVERISVDAVWVLTSARPYRAPDPQLRRLAHLQGRTADSVRTQMLFQNNSTDGCLFR
jgi:hypothetical protein